MTLIKVFHNPTAGDAEHTKEKLVKKIKSAGFDCSYSSTKKGINEKRIPDSTDIIAVAGGDGTVRKIAEYYCGGTIINRRHPLALLPWGTANNIAKTLGINGDVDEIIGRWKLDNRQNFDIGKVHGLKDNHFFLESVGFGVFPKLIKTMRDRTSKSESPDEEIMVALKTLRDLVEDYKPKSCEITIDGETYNGKFLMVEVTNIKSIGPNLNIAPMSHFDDGEFDVIMIGESQREALLSYIDERIANGKETPFFYTALKARKIELNWGGRLMHIDDELLELDVYQKLEVEILRDVLTFLV
ncbi:diacylglycerol kinase family protein [Chryseolinea sp. T2]|uniref:diacylglycerol/lipid kinase family protein n=1 Tax=Chryseolinea sp. T2 TaxID=3129255 RepID=UPI0030787A28